MAELKGKRVLVTGASELVAFPVARELAKDNEVFVVARFSDPAQLRLLEAAGTQPVAFDLANDDLSALPNTVDVVINYAVLPFTQLQAYHVNAGTVPAVRRMKDD